MRMLDPVLVVHCPRDETPFGERISEEMLSAIGNALDEQGRRSKVIPYSALHDNPGNCVRGNLVFNLAYGWIDPRGWRRFDQPEVARRLRSAGALLIGSEPDALERAQDKLACAEVLAHHGIAIPHMLGSKEFAGDFVVRKPRFGACHRGVTIMGVSDALALPISPGFLLQEYVSGPEYTVGVVDGRALPAMRVIVGDASGPTALGATPGDVRLLTDADQPTGLDALAESIGPMLGLDDYYRIDIRMRGDVPVVLDVNALPNLGLERSFLPMIAEAAGWSYGYLIRAIVSSAERRWGAAVESTIPAVAGTCGSAIQKVTVA